jgi:hypothetical protein
VCSDLSVIEFVKKTNLKDMFFLTAKAWNQVTPKSIANCWNHALKGAFTSDDPTSDDDDDDDEEFHGFTAAEVREAEDKLRGLLDTDQDLDSYLDLCATLDDDAPVYHDPTDDEIVAQVQEEKEEPEEQEQPVDLFIPSAAEAAAGLTAGLKWLETQDVEPFKLIQLRGLIQLATKSSQASLKQKKFTDFFKK